MTLPEFLTSVQEMVLVERHGALPEEFHHRRAMRSQVYRFEEKRFQELALSFCVELTLGDRIALELTSERYYHYQGAIVRRFNLSAAAYDCRSDGDKARDIMGIQLAGWLGMRCFEPGPQRLCFVYTVGEEGEAPRGRHVTEVPFSDPVRMDQWVRDRLQALANGLEQADDQLPSCTPEERYAVSHYPYNKCLDFCRARHACVQYRRHVEAIQKMLPQNV